MTRSLFPLLSRWSRIQSLRVFLFYSLLAVVFTYPLILRMKHEVVGTIGDNIYFIFLIRWYQKALLELHINPFFHPYLNYPEGWHLASTDTTPAMMLLAIPASWVGGDVWGYNFAMLASFVLTGLGMFWWVRSLTRNAWAGLIAGMLFAFMPYRMAHYLAGHLNLAGTQWFPLYFWGLYELLHRQQWSLKSVLLTALSLGLISATAPYYLYMTLFISVVFVAGYLLWLARPRVKERVLWQNLAAFSLIGLPLALLPMLPYIALGLQGGLADRSIDLISRYSASPTDFLLPSTDHFLWGRWIGEHFDRSFWVEATLYVGFFTLILALLAWLKRRQTGHLELVKLSLLIVSVGVILAMGTDLHWLSQRVVIRVPWFLQQLLQRETAPIPLPGFFLVKFLPFFGKMRVMMRFGVFVHLFASLLAGLGAAWLLQRTNVARRSALALILLLLIFIDFYPGPYPQFSHVDARPVDYWLADQPARGAVAQFPFYQDADQDQVYNTLVHGKPYIGGFFNATLPPQYLRIRPVLERFPDSASVTLLRELGVGYVIVDSGQYDSFPMLHQQIQTLGLQFLYAVAGQYVYIFP